MKLIKHKLLTLLTTLPMLCLGVITSITSCSPETSTTCTISLSVEGCGSLSTYSLIVAKNTTWGSIKDSFNPTPNPGYYFDCWTMNGYRLNNDYVINSNINVIANFLETREFELITDIDESIVVKQLPIPTKGYDYKLSYTIDSSLKIDLANSKIMIGNSIITQYATIDRNGLYIPKSYINNNLYIKLKTTAKSIYSVSTIGSSSSIAFNNLPTTIVEGDDKGISATYSFNSETKLLKEDECDILVGNKSIKDNKYVKYLDGQIVIPYWLITGNISIKIVVKSILLVNTWSQIIDYCNQYESGSILTKEDFISKFSTEDGSITSVNDLIGCITYLSINNINHKVRIIDIDHDSICGSDSKAALTFELETLLSDTDGSRLTSTWTSYSDNNYDYTNSTLRKNLNNTGNADIEWRDTSGSKFISKNISVLDMIQQDVVPYIKTVTKQTSIYKDSFYTVIDYSDKLFPLTYTELGLSGSLYANIEGQAYKYWIDNDTIPSKVKYDASGNKADYLLSTPYLNNFLYNWKINKDGSITTCHIARTNSISFGFCI